MATLNDLRTRGAFFLSIVIGIALIAFLLGDLTSASSIFQNRRNRVGVIDGTAVDYMEFARENDAKTNVIQALYGRSALSAEEHDQIRDMVWESYVREYAYDPGFKRMGLTVGQAEQYDMIRGQYVSPVITSLFSSPQTGIYDPSIVEGFIANLDNDTSGQMEAVWSHIKDQMSDERTMSKYLALVTAGLFANDLEVAQGVRAANSAYSGEYVEIPYSSVADSLVKVSSSEARAFYKENKGMFAQTAQRDIEYVVFDLLPSESDYAEAEAHIEDMAAEFANAESPMQYASLNSQERTDDRYYSEDELSPELAAIAFGARRGEMSGPTLRGDVYTVSRVADIRMMPDSVGARHILLPAAQRSVADSLIRAIRGGRSIFDMASYSMDQRVDLGVFPPDMMVEPFAKAVSAARKGDVFSVETQYGVHVVEMTYVSPLTRKAQIATISYSVEPSPTTQQTAYNKARDFLAAAGSSQTDFNAAVDQMGLSRRVAAISPSDRNVRGLEDSRELVRWSFNNKPGAVSQIMDIDGDYVVALLVDAREAGTARLEDVSAQIAARLRNDKKAAVIAEQLAGKNIDQAAEMASARRGQFEGVEFNSFYIPDLGVEPGVIGALLSLEQGAVSDPVKGMAGMYVLRVDNVEQTGEATDASERVRLEATAQTALMQRVMQALQEGTEITDNRAKFF